MPNVLDGSSALESPTVPDETSIDSTTSIQTNQTITPPSPISTQTLGFCYSCNRRSLIDTSNYSCANCSSGFVELIADESTSNRARTNQNSDIEFESLFDNSLLRLINLSSPERQNRYSNIFAENNETSTGATSSSSESEPLFSRFRNSSRRNESNRNRYRNFLDDNLEPGYESYRSSSSSRRRSRSPPNQGRTSSRPLFRSRIFNYFDDDSNILLDHGAIIITTLINQLRNRGAAPASETQIQNLPIVTIDQQLVDENVQCAVCMDDFTMNEQAKKLPCKHLFHDPCIAQWLKLHATCPVCRNNINGEESNNVSNSSTLINENGPTFFNIIPFTPEPTSSSSSTSSNNSSSNQRRNNLNLRNHNLYRIHIRPNLSETRRSETSNEDPIGHRISHGIRVSTRLSNGNQDSQNNNSNNSGRNTHLNFNQMMRQFMSRDQVQGLGTNNSDADQDQNLRSSIRVTTRLANPEPSNIDEGSGSRFNNMIQHLMSQFRQVNRTIDVNRQTEGNSDDDVIEIDPETNHDEETPSEDLPNAKRRRV